MKYKKLDFSILEDKDYLLLEKVFSGNLSENDVTILTKNLDINTGDFQYMQFLSMIGHKYGWTYFPKHMIPRLSGLYKYFRLERLLCDSWFYGVINMLQTHGIVPMILGDNAVNIHTNKHIIKMVNNNEISVSIENYDYAKKLLKKNGLINTNETTFCSIWTNSAKNKNENIILCNNCEQYIWTRSIDTQYNNVDVKVISKEDLCVRNLNQYEFLFNFKQSLFNIRDWIFNCRCLFGDKIDIYKLSEIAKCCNKEYGLYIILEEYSKCFPHLLSEKEFKKFLPDVQKYYALKQRVMEYNLISKKTKFENIFRKYKIYKITQSPPPHKIVLKKILQNSKISLIGFCYSENK